jgi:hypothetical protein
MTTEQTATRIQEAAEDIIANLKFRPDVIASWTGAAEGDRDYVFVTEFAEAALDDADLPDGTDADPDNADAPGSNHTQVCGLVFAWLQAEYGLTPPAWYVEATGGGK